MDGRKGGKKEGREKKKGARNVIFENAKASWIEITSVIQRKKALTFLIK